MSSKLGFIGAGNMGSAIISGLIESGKVKPSDVMVSDPRSSARDDLKIQHPGIHTVTDNCEVAHSRIVILSVKPAVCLSIASQIADALDTNTIIVTVAAGISIDAVSRRLRSGTKVVRTMPNTPALVNAGMTALCPGPEADETDMAMVTGIFEAVGRTIRMPESLMDAYTALAGSSPAWVFMFLEALADGAVREGIPRESAYIIAASTVLGSAKLALESGCHPAELKDRVCSPSGTTIEAVATLERCGFRSAIIEAVRNCAHRAGELNTT